MHFFLLFLSCDGRSHAGGRSGCKDFGKKDLLAVIIPSSFNN